MALTPLNEIGLSPRVRDPLAEVRALGSAPVTLLVGSEEDLAGTAGGKHEWDDRTGPSTVTVLRPDDEALVAHELLHVAFLRRGYPVITIRTNEVPVGVSEFANRMEAAAIHPVLWNELRARGFDDTEYWSAQWMNLDAADGPEPSLRDDPLLLLDAIVLADALASAAEIPDGAFERVSVHSPLTSEIARTLQPLIVPERGQDKQARAAALSRLIDKADEVLAFHRVASLRLRTWLTVDL